MIVKSYHIRFMLFCLILLSLPPNICAFEPIKNLPTKNSHFTGRTSYLNIIHKILAQYGQVYLTGYGGIGKTQIAKEFSHIHASDYDIIWWFDLREDLIIQYENLLTQLSNHKEFSQLLHIKANDIAIDIVVNFTNSLLEKSNYRWLLIFDNANNTTNIAWPKTKGNGQHVIITTRTKHILGNNVLPIHPFTDQEAEQFLFKIHPTETKENIIKLYKTLHNYPLALAQISDKILMHQNGILQYFKNSDNTTKDVNTKSSMYSDVSQEYTNNYHTVLNSILEEIEHKNKKTAEVLYILTLISKANITKKSFQELFKNQFDEELATLNRYGVLQIDPNEKSQVLHIHDIIREEAAKRFSHKKIPYKKEIINTISNYFNDFYSEQNLKYLNSTGATNKLVTPLYAFINVALDNNIIDEKIINMLIVALRLNDTFFGRYSSYSLYQQLANHIYGKNLNKVPPLKQALLYANLIYSDLILDSPDNLTKFENDFSYLINLIKDSRDYDKLFFIYTYLAKFYLMQGRIDKAKKCIKIAKKNLNHTVNIFNLLQYWYINAWYCYEIRDLKNGLHFLDIYEKLIKQLPANETNELSPEIFRIKFKILAGQKNESKKAIEEVMKKIMIYYNNTISYVAGNVEFNKALLYFHDNRYNLALHYAKRALTIFNQDPGDMKSANHGDLYMMLGKIYAKQGNSNLALEHYNKSLKFYDFYSHGKIINAYGYGELLSDLIIFYYKLKNYPQSKFYLQKLITNFGLEHMFVKKLIKALPINYIYQVGKQ